MQTDAVIGQIINAIDESKFKKNTLIIVTSDNGCSGSAGFSKLQNQGHYPSAQFRGKKKELWEGGHRVPFILRWPKVIKVGTRSDQLICLNDLMATCADIVETTVPENAGEDSVSFLPALTGKPIETTRVGVAHHSFDGDFAYRIGKWKLLLKKDLKGKESKDAPGQLYDIEQDPGETTNLYAEYPKVVEGLFKQLESDVSRGRSTDGESLNNDVDDIVLWKKKK